MTGKAVTFISTILVIASLCLLSFGCKSSPSIIGKWQSSVPVDNGTATIEITREGDIIDKEPKGDFVMKYELVGRDIIKIYSPESPESPTVFQYVISGSTMVWKDNSSDTTFSFNRTLK